MKVLLLGSDNRQSETLREYLSSRGETVSFRTARLLEGDLRELSPDIIATYNYRFILPRDIFTFPPLGTVNVHISYLPWNRGADPNFWSHVEGTPKGVSLHYIYIDEGIDRGDLIAREAVHFSEDDTLKTSYEKLHAKIQTLFATWWPEIREGRCRRVKQEVGGTFHLKRHREPFESLLAKRGWDTPIRELAECRLDHQKIHGRNAHREGKP